MPSLEELQAAEAAQGTVQLRTLVLEFSDTLKRLPRLQQEIDGWLNQAPVGVDFNALATRVEAQLVRATEWLVDYDMLHAAVRDAPEMKDFMQRVAYTATGRTLETMVQKFQGVKLEAENLAVNAKKDAEKRAAKIRQEAEDRAAKIRQEERTAKALQENRAANAYALAALGYVDNGNGTVTNRGTGLMWKQFREKGNFTFDDAVKRFKGKDGAVRCGGFADWRLPTIYELKTLILKGRSPAICQEAFPDSDRAFWSSSEDGSSVASLVNFNIGSVDRSNRKSSFAVRLVRASQ